MYMYTLLYRQSFKKRCMVEAEYKAKYGGWGFNYWQLACVEISWIQGQLSTDFEANLLQWACMEIS
jgi:hypothetical protein